MAMAISSVCNDQNHDYELRGFPIRDTACSLIPIHEMGKPVLEGQQPRATESFVPAASHLTSPPTNPSVV